MREIYHRYRRGVAYITVENDSGEESIGTAFHIGQGYFVTAKHVLENNKILEVCLTQPLVILKDPHSDPLNEQERPKLLEVDSSPIFAEDEIDVALFQVRDHKQIPAIPLSSDHDIYRSEDQTLLSQVLCIGYPPIPLTTHPFQVVVDATINSMVRVRASDYLTYILSSTARGGFSGGPIIDENGHAIALVTEGLVWDHNAAETGFMACLSCSAAADLAISAGWDADAAGFYRDIESLVSIKMAQKDTMKLNPHIYDMRIYIYDDDRDVYIEISCLDSKDRQLAVDTFHAICPIRIHQRNDVGIFATPVDNPSAELLVKTGKAVRETLTSVGYHTVNQRFTKGWHTV